MSQSSGPQTRMQLQEIVQQMMMDRAGAASGGEWPCPWQRCCYHMMTSMSCHPTMWFDVAIRELECRKLNLPADSHVHDAQVRLLELGGPSSSWWLGWLAEGQRREGGGGANCAHGHARPVVSKSFYTFSWILRCVCLISKVAGVHTVQAAPASDALY